jgi:D-aminopeptidase
MRTANDATGPVARAVLPPAAVSPLFQAALETTEEAVYNSMLQATTTTGRGRTAEALPVDRVREILQRYGRGPATPR